MFNKKLNRLLAIMLASVMGATSLPATQVSADTPSSEYDISNDAASDDISDSKIPDEQDSDNNATEEKQPQQLTVEYTPADDIYVGNKVVPVVKSDRADAAVDNLKYTVVEGKNLIEKDTDFASNGIWTAKDNNVKRSIVMEDSEKVIVNFVNENNGKRHELEIPLNITAKALVTALNKAYNLQIDEANENECYMACEQPIAFLKGNRMLEDFGVRNGSTIIFGRK